MTAVVAEQVDSPLVLEIRMCERADKVCLEGGCIYCAGGRERDHWWRSEEWWREYAERRGWIDAWRFGRSLDWSNHETREALASRTKKQQPRKV